jgi:hypothetical protein
MLHVGMNIAEKERVATEVARVLRSGSEEVFGFPPAVESILVRASGSSLPSAAT